MRNPLGHTGAEPPSTWIKKFPATKATGDPPSWLRADEHIFVKDAERCWIIRVREIGLIESEGNYTRIHFGANRALMYRSLKYWEQRLDPMMFLRASRHSIINLRDIKEIAPWVNGGFRVRLTSGGEIEVSRRRGQALRAQISL